MLKPQHVSELPSSGTLKVKRWSSQILVI